MAEIQYALRGVLARRGQTMIETQPSGGALAGGSRGARDLRLDGRWVAVLAAHGGGGASTVALALADAMTSKGRHSRLVELTAPARSGLVAATQTELGLDDTEGWRRGTRGLCTVLRRAATAMPQSWPQIDDLAETIVDVGLPSADGLPGLAGDGAQLVVVCRATVSGVRACEQMLTCLPGERVLLAAVGPARWPGPVLAASGPRVRAAREQNRLVPIPHERRLEIAGLTASRLPGSVAAAGRVLLDLLGTDRGDTHAPSAAGTPQPKGASQ